MGEIIDDLTPDELARYAEPGRYFTQDGQFLPTVLVDDISRKYRFALQNQVLYVYQNGVYVETVAEFIKNVAKIILQDRYRDNRGAEVARQVVTSCWRQSAFFIDDLNEINVANGILNWRTGILRTHSPEYPSRIQVPVEYQPGEQCQRVLQFFHEVLQPDCLELAAEIFGHCLIPDVSMQKAFLLKSSGESGKSVFLDLLTAFLGRSNVSHEKLQDLGENRFRTANLVGKLANVFADLPTQYLEETDVFKTLVSGDGMSAERKGRDPFPFRNTARLLFSANELPRSSDNSHGFFRRWIILDFPGRFPQGSPSRDETILQKLTTPKELSGLLNLAVTGLRRLKARGYFAVPATAQANLEEYQRTNDSVRLFCSELVEQNNQCRVDRGTLFARYRNFCADENLKAVGSRRFCSRLREIFPDISEVKSNGMNYWIGIKCDDWQ